MLNLVIIKKLSKDDLDMIRFDYKNISIMIADAIIIISILWITSLKWRWIL